MIGAPSRNAFDGRRERALAALAVARAWSRPRCRPAAAPTSRSRSGRCAGPALRTATRRSRTVGSASAANARASVEERAERARATGFEASTSGSTSFERRAQVHERGVGAAHERRQPLDRLGQRQPSGCPARGWSSFRLPIRPERSSRRSASAVTSFELSTRKRSSIGWSLVSSLNRRLEVDSAGFRYWKASLASLAARRGTGAPGP